MKYNTERDARLATEYDPARARNVHRWNEFHVDLVVRCPRPAPCHSGPKRLRRFLFSARCCSGASTSTHAAHAHRTTWRRFSTSATVRTRSRTRGARVSLGTRPQRRSTETLLDFRFRLRPTRTASDHFPPTRPRAAAKVYVATEAAIGLGLGLVAGAVWKVRLETRETRAPTRNRWPAAPRSPHPLTRRKNIRKTERNAFLDIRTRG